MRVVSSKCDCSEVMTSLVYAMLVWILKASDQFRLESRICVARIRCECSEGTDLPAAPDVTKILPRG